MEQLIMDKDCSTTVSLNQLWGTESNKMKKFRGNDLSHLY